MHFTVLHLSENKRNRKVMNGSQPGQMIPPECGTSLLTGRKLPPSATELQHVQAVLIFLAVINIIKFPFTIALNALVITAVKMKSRIRAHKSNILLACLATTDLMVGVIIQPMFAALMIVHGGEPKRLSCGLQKLAPISTTVLYASLTHMALISGERYIAMKHTYAYHNGLVTEARLLIGSALAWLVPLGLLIPFYAVKPALFFVINNTFISLCIASIIYCQIAVYSVVRRHEKQLSTQQVTEEARQKFLRDKKAFKLTAIIVSLLFICYLPIIVFRVVVLKYRNNMSVVTLTAGIRFSLWVVILNSLLNPLIYSVSMRQFRVAFIELICRTAHIAEAEQIDMRYFRSSNSIAVNRIGAGQEKGDQQNTEQTNNTRQH